MTVTDVHARIQPPAVDRLRDDPLVTQICPHWSRSHFNWKQPMPLPVTSLEKRILTIVAVLVIFGLVGMAFL